MVSEWIFCDRTGQPVRCLERPCFSRAGGVDPSSLSGVCESGRRILLC